jgi:D-alanyl-lipoteichoic acid acyltransferase DltB (MBOAT superfamily)
MAIGLGLMFNVRLPDNFDAPYKARNIAEFWRRWHITLGRFLRNYLYIPLGGNRLGVPRACLNLFATLLVGGLWHGAGWKFLAWGAYHGLLLVAFYLVQQMGGGIRIPGVLARCITFLLVTIGWTFFRAHDLPSALAVLGALFQPGSFRLENLTTGLTLGHLVGIGGLLVLVNAAPTTRAWIERAPLNRWQAAGCAAVFCIALFLMRDVSLSLRKSEFIYFNF